MKKGLLIVLDGVDGSGKGEQLKLLEKNLPELYPDRAFIYTREPGGPLYAEKIRKLILEEPEARFADALVMTQLFGAARFEHLAKTIRPAILRREVVISDRFESSTYAFQLIAQHGGKEATKLLDVQHQIIAETIPPWKTIVLDVEVKVAMARAEGRAGQAKTHFDQRRQNFHERVRVGFKQYAALYPGVSFVDASGSIEEVQAQVLKLIKGYLD